MSGPAILVLCTLAGLVAGYFTGRRRRTSRPSLRSSLPDAATPHLLPDPALEWMRRAVDALGVWAIETKGPGRGARTYQSLAPEWRAANAELELIEQHLNASTARESVGSTPSRTIARRSVLAGPKRRGSRASIRKRSRLRAKLSW